MEDEIKETAQKASDECFSPNSFSSTFSFLIKVIQEKSVDNKYTDK